MAFPWTVIVKWLLPTVPELIASTMKQMKKQEGVPNQASALHDVAGRIERLEKTLELQAHINEQLAAQFEKLQRRVQWLSFSAVFALVLALIALGVAALR